MFGRRIFFLYFYFPFTFLLLFFAYVLRGIIYFRGGGSRANQKKFALYARRHIVQKKWVRFFSTPKINPLYSSIIEISISSMHKKTTTTMGLFHAWFNKNRRALMTYDHWWDKEEINLDDRLALKPQTDRNR